MSLKIIVLIRKDPRVTPQPVEGLRIALGLSTGPNQLTIIVLGQARLLLTEEIDSAVLDEEILEKYIPAIQDLDLPIIVPEDSQRTFDFDSDFSITEKSEPDIQALIQEAERVLMF